MPLSDKREGWCLLVQDYAKEGTVDVDFIIVLDKAQFPEFVHEKIDPRAHVVPIISASIPCDTLGSTLCGWLLCAPVVRQQQQCAPYRFSLELKSWSSRSSSIQMFRVSIYVMKRSENACSACNALNHFVCLNDQHGGRRNRSRCRHANGLSRQAPFPKKIARSKNCHNGFLAGLIDHGKLHTAFLNVHHVRRGSALPKDLCFCSKFGNASPRTG
jgi:hypothetical protein